MKAWKVIIAGVITAALFGYGGYRYYLLVQELKSTNELFTATVTEFKAKVSDLETELEHIKKENQDLVIALLDETNKNEAITGELKGLANTVKDFEKLNSLDPELLQKYSKVFFLNENYTPAATSSLETKYLLDPKKPIAVQAQMLPYLQKMLLAADIESVPIQVISGYRSFGDQSSLKSSYKVIFGAGTANQFSAEQGYSEHQLGTALDFTTPDIKLAFTKFESTLAYTWLTQHAYQYGFILSYPKGNQYYVFEPWHWRFVGVELATKLKNDGKKFYDLDQREIDAYLIKIFD